MADAEQQELLSAFVEEGNELLDETEPLLIELESKSRQSGEIDDEVLNTVFRAFHSLKGGAGFLNLNTIGLVTHEAETLLDLFRKSRGNVQSSHIDLLNRASDFLRQRLKQIAEEFSDAGFEEEAAAIVAALRQQIDSITADIAQIDTPSGLTREPGTGITKEPISSHCSEEEASEAELMLTITPEMVEQFVVEAEDLLAVTEEALLKLDKNPANGDCVAEAFRALHSLKGNAGFLGYRDIESISHQAESVLDSIRTGGISGNSELFTLLLDILDFLREGVAQAAAGNQPCIPARAGLMNLVQDAVEQLEVSGQNVPPLRVPAESPARESTGSGTEGGQHIKQESFPNQRRAPADPSGNGMQRQSIRVDVEKIDALLDLVGELVIAETMVAQNPDLQVPGFSLENFHKSATHLNKLTRDLQDIATSIRMIPLAATFRRMIRLVRDLAQKTGKRVELEIEGEETAVDKTVIELITDPLVHIIRNSIDHGIGTPGIRREQGKPEVGHLKLEAGHHGGEVWISVSDDGMGLDRDLILKKAAAKSHLTGSDTDMQDEEVWQLIFQPGFSTAATVTDVSGRGVGLDVVKRNIEKIGGKVEMRSVWGQGAEILLRIPLTLAIMDGMIVDVGTHCYIIPIMAIRETVRISPDQITRTMGGQEIVNLRGSLYPVIRLHQFYDIQPEYTQLQDGVVVVVEGQGHRFGLFVDKLVAQRQVVIKGLSDYVGHIKAISGCTILGDGTVCLILDVATLAEALEDAEVVMQGRRAEITGSNHRPPLSGRSLMDIQRDGTTT